MNKQEAVANRLLYDQEKVKVINFHFYYYHLILDILYSILIMIIIFYLIY
jgi:hypothetical protein